jgi:class 3 adenylate cyclase/tetratricopeptide (TPR) repeat protein
MKFCGECGQEIHPSCPHCGFTNPPNFKFCGNCGCELSVGKIATIDIPPQSEEISVAEDRQDENTCYGPDSERKCVTVMFSDLTGYTEMSEKLDPEEVKEITSAIFGELTKIIEKYDGFIEKYIGDAILAVFGAKEAFEDSALRAIKAAREIHAHVESVSPKYEKLIGRTLTMHTGINTGVVVTGEINFEKGTHGLVGDTINTAARLMSVSNPGEIVVDKNSFAQTAGYYEFDTLPLTKVKGKSELIQAYRVVKAIVEPKKVHRLHGLRAQLIGRSTEMLALQDAVENLEQGMGSVVAISGTAGTGKSRLIHEFQQTLDLEKIRWLDANAYPYTQNTPYYPLIDLLTRAFGIVEDDDHKAIKRKINTTLKGLLGKDSEMVPYIGSLFSIDYAETREVSPEYWKDRLSIAVADVLDALTSSRPTVLCLEDMHWSDLSTIELIRTLISNASGPLLVICIYRPIVSIFTEIEIQGSKIDYTELSLRELSASEAQEMVYSLLETDDIPKNLRGFIRDNIEGNPFYIEELINTLVTSEALSKVSGQWVLTNKMDESLISTNIQGVLTGRIDRLESDTKRILQEASVIGKTFLFEILQRISAVKYDINRHLLLLERLDFIRAKSIQPTLEYIFKHTLTQEVVYNGLLRAERKEIHEKIGLAIEMQFHHRRQEYYEILAYHFKHGRSQVKAAEYLIRAGKKSFYMCAVEETYTYYKEAYEILSKRLGNGDDEKRLFIELLHEWGIALIWQMATTELIELFMRHIELVEDIDDKEKSSLFFSTLGIALQTKGQLLDSYPYLRKSLDLAEKANSVKAIGYAAFRLSQICANLGNLDEAVRLVERARIIADDPTSELPLHRITVSLVIAYLYKGNIRKLREFGNDLLNRKSNKKDLRNLATANIAFGASHFCAGEYYLAIKDLEMMFEVTIDPLITQFAKILLGYAYIGQGEYQKAFTISEDITHFSERYGSEYLGAISMTIKGFALAASGNLDKGLKVLDSVENIWRAENRLYGLAMLSCFYGQLYLNIVQGKNSKDLTLIIKNIRSMFRLVPGAAEKCERHFNNAIEITSNINAEGLLGQAYFGLGRLCLLQNRDAQAQDYIHKAIAIFEKMEASGFLKVAKAELASISSESGN